LVDELIDLHFVLSFSKIVVLRLLMVEKNAIHFEVDGESCSLVYLALNFN